MIYLFRLIFYTLTDMVFPTGSVLCLGSPNREFTGSNPKELSRVRLKKLTVRPSVNCLTTLSTGNYNNARFS